MLGNLWISITNKEYRDGTNYDLALTTHAECHSQRSLRGKTVIVTGGNSGIGKECCRDFVRREARVIMACRSLMKGEDAKKDIETDTGIYGNLLVMNIDLASLISVRNFVEEFKKRESRLDILLNNAGLTRFPGRFSVDGFEGQMASNHIGHFLLTYLLIDMLKSSAPSRVVNVSSLVHYGCKDMKFDDFHDKGGCCGSCCSTNEFKLYARSKAANVLFTKEFSKRFSKDGVTSYSCHPGIVKTNFLNHLNPCTDCLTVCLFKMLTDPNKPYVKTPIQGAQSPIYCYVQEDIESESGNYFTECKPKEMSKFCQDDNNAIRLWNLTNELVGADW